MKTKTNSKAKKITGRAKMRGLVGLHKFHLYHGCDGKGHHRRNCGLKAS